VPKADSGSCSRPLVPHRAAIIATLSSPHRRR